MLWPPSASTNGKKLVNGLAKKKHGGMAPYYRRVCSPYFSADVASCAAGIVVVTS